MSEQVISVVVPCRNERRTLIACLDALEAQDFPGRRFEVILVDGRSTDGCPQLAAARGLRVLQDHGRGPAGARNVGIWASRGAVVAFTDADCVPRFDWLSGIDAAFRDDPTIAGVAGPMRLPRATLLGRLEDNDARRHYRGYITSNVAYRRDVLFEVGGFDEDLCCAEDYDLAWRVLDRGHRIAHDERPVVLHDPPELYGAPWPYLRKQYWYARNDVPTHVRALARAASSPDARAGSAAAISGSFDALSHAAPAVAIALGLAAPRTAAAGIGLAFGRAVRHAWRNVVSLGEGWADLPAIVAVQTAKSLTRGVGTLAGLASLADPREWGSFRAREIGAGPARPQPSPRAEMDVG